MKIVEIDKGDFDAELTRLQRLGLDVTTFEHRWCQWRSLYVRDPEGNILELVCYDETIEWPGGWPRLERAVQRAAAEALAVGPR